MTNRIDRIVRDPGPSVSELTDAWLKSGGTIFTTSGGVSLSWTKGCDVQKLERYGDMTDSRERLRVLGRAFAAANKARKGSAKSA